MRVNVTDSAVFSSLRPDDIISYLRSHGWIDVDRIRDLATVWKLPEDVPIPTEVIVPNDTSVADFAARIYDLVYVLASIEKRTQIDVISDIRNITSDVVRLYIDSPMFTDSGVSMESGNNALSIIRELFEAAVEAAVNPLGSSRNANRSNTQIEKHAREFLGPLKFDPLSLSGRAITIISPTTYTSGREETHNLDRRLVLITLARALSEIQHAISPRSVSDSLDQLAKSTLVGVTPALCDVIHTAFVRLEARRLSVRFSWSSLIEIPDNTPSAITLRSLVVPSVKKAARYLGSRQLTISAVISGFVVKLEKLAHTTWGMATIDAYIEGRWQTIRVRLEDEHYADAVSAHSKGRPVTFQGELIPEGNYFVLRPVSDRRGEITSTQLTA